MKYFDWTSARVRIFSMRRSRFARFFLRLYKFIRDSEFQLISSAMAYTTTLSIVPLLALAFSIFKYLGGVEKLPERMTPFLLQFLTVGTGSAFTEKLILVLNRASGRTLGLIGLLALLFTSTRMMSQLERGIQKIWGIQKRRAWYHRVIAYFFALVVLPTLIAFVLGLLGTGQVLSPVLSDPRPLIAMILFAIIFSINKWTPRAAVRWRSAAVAALVTTIGLVLLQSIFVGITRNILLYNKIYGSFASIPIFLIWIQWCWTVFFLGVSFCAGIETSIFKRKSTVERD